MRKNKGITLVSLVITVRIGNKEGYRYWSQDTIKNELKIEGGEQSFMEGYHFQYSI